MKKFELLLADGTIRERYGVDGPHAAQRYADAHPGSAVVATRRTRCTVAVVNPDQIIG